MHFILVLVIAMINTAINRIYIKCEQGSFIMEDDVWRRGELTEDERFKDEFTELTPEDATYFLMQALKELGGLAPKVEDPGLARS